MRRIHKGFTLVELMIAVAVIAVVVGVAIPSFTDQIRNNRSVVIAEGLVSAINMARAEAVKRATRVSICASQNGEACGGAWTDGWIVFVDGALSDNAAAPVIDDAAVDILRVWEAPDQNAEINEVNNKTFIRYTSTGVLGRVDMNPISISAQIKECTGTSARQIQVGLAGVVNLNRIDCW